MKNQSQAKREVEIIALKEALRQLGPLHPGSLSQQKRARGETYHQLSFSHAGKGHTLYVRPAAVDAVRREIENYRRFRQLTGKWIALEVELAAARRRTPSAETNNNRQNRGTKNRKGAKRQSHINNG